MSFFRPQGAAQSAVLMSEGQRVSATLSPANGATISTWADSITLLADRPLRVTLARHQPRLPGSPALASVRRRGSF
jgi:hypothetical protein